MPSFKSLIIEVNEIDNYSQLNICKYNNLIKIKIKFNKIIMLYI